MVSFFLFWIVVWAIVFTAMVKWRRDQRERIWRQIEEAGIPLKGRDGDTAQVAGEHGTLYLRIANADRNPFWALESPIFVGSGAAFTIGYRESCFGLGDLFTPSADTRMWALGDDWEMCEITLSDPKIDREYRICANDESVIRALFANETIRGLLLAQPRLSFAALPPTTIRSRMPVYATRQRDRHHELIFSERGVLRDAGRLKSLIALIEATHEELLGLGARRKTA